MNRHEIAALATSTVQTFRALDSLMGAPVEKIRRPRKPRAPTQAELAAAGKARELAAFRVKFAQRYDTEPRQAAAFVAGLMKPTRFPAHPLDPTTTDLLEAFITEHGLQGHLLRACLAGATSPTPYSILSA